MEDNTLNDLSKKSVTVAMAERFGMESANFERVLRATVVPANCGPEQFAAFLLVAKQYNLNPITKEIYAFPSKGGGIQPIVGVDGWMRIINDHEDMDGMEFEDRLEDGKLVSITAKIFRKSRQHPTAITEYMSECLRDTDPWKKWPARMLRHKAAIQAARYAFGFSGIMEPDEYERGPGASLGAKSAHQARKDGDWEPLVAEMRKCATPDELRGWWQDNMNRIDALPRNWKTHLDDEHARLLGLMNPEHPLKRPRGRPPKIKEQLRASVELEKKPVKFLDGHAEEMTEVELLDKLGEVVRTTGEIINDEIPKFEPDLDTYLDDLESELNVAQTIEDLDIIHDQYLEVKDGLFPLDRDKAQDLFLRHRGRIAG